MNFVVLSLAIIASIATLDPARGDGSAQPHGTIKVLKKAQKYASIVEGSHRDANKRAKASTWFINHNEAECTEQHFRQLWKAIDDCADDPGRLNNLEALRNEPALICKNQILAQFHEAFKKISARSRSDLKAITAAIDATPGHKEITSWGLKSALSFDENTALALLNYLVAKEKEWNQPLGKAGSPRRFGNLISAVPISILPVCREVDNYLRPFQYIKECGLFLIKNYEMAQSMRGFRVCHHFLNNKVKLMRIMYKQNPQKKSRDVSFWSPSLQKVLLESDLATQVQ